MIDAVLKMSFCFFSFLVNFSFEVVDEANVIARMA